MPRPARFYILAETPAKIHWVWRCHNKEFLLKDDDVKLKLLKLIKIFKKRYGILLNHYNLMDNHPHFVLSIPSRTNWERFSRTVNSQLARYINKKYGRCGSVVMDRPKTIVLQRDEDVLRVMRYIDLNPVRAGMVKSPKDYRWSSYRHYAYGEKDPLIDECAVYKSLAFSPYRRRQIYQGFFSRALAQVNLRRRSDLMDVYFVGTVSWVERRLQEVQGAIKSREDPLQTISLNL